MTITITPSGAYQDNYYYLNVGPTTATSFTYSTEWQIPNASDLNRFQGIETDFHESYTDGWSYTGGVQFLAARAGGPAVRVYDLADEHWVGVSGLAMPLVDTAYHSLSYTFSIDYAAHLLTYDTITIDGVTTKLGQIYGGKVLNWSPLLNAAVQQDGDSSNDSFTLNIKNWTVSPNNLSGCY